MGAIQEKLAKAMAHSVAMQRIYDRLPTPEEVVELNEDRAQAKLEREAQKGKAAPSILPVKKKATKPKVEQAPTGERVPSPAAGPRPTPEELAGLTDKEKRARRDKWYRAAFPKGEEQKARKAELDREGRERERASSAPAASSSGARASTDAAPPTSALTQQAARRLRQKTAPADTPIQPPPAKRPKGGGRRKKNKNRNFKQHG